MLTRISILIAFLILLVSSRVAQSQQPDISNGVTAGETLTLEQAIALALGENRQIKSAAIEVEKYSDKMAALRTKRLPEFKFYTLASQLLTPMSFTFEKGAFGAYGDIGPIPDKTTEITTPRRPTLYLSGQITQPLSQLHRINLNLKQLGVGRQIAGQQLRLQRQTIINNVRRSYYAILQTQSSLRASEEAIRLYQELDRVTGEYVVQQVALKSESLEVRTRLEKAKYDALTLGDQLATQKEQLNQLLGRATQTEFSVSPVPALSGYETDMAAAREQALQQRPEIKEAQLKIKQAVYERKIKKSEFIPEVGLAFNYVSPFNTNFLPKNVASIGVSVSWEPFDWGRKKREVKEKARSIEQAELALREAENNVRTEVNTKFRKLLQARRLLVIQRLSQESSGEKLRVISNRYKLQAALLGDVLNAQTVLAEADNQYQQALLAFWAARADFEKALGGDQ
jgi:outer membrane protein TolC